MSRQYWKELIAWATADGTAIANSAAETIIFPNVTVPGNYMSDGRVLAFEASGRLSTTGTPTLIFRLRWGGVAGTLLLLSETMTMGSGITNLNWWIDGIIQTRANGATGSLFVMGNVAVHTSASAVIANVIGVSGSDTPAAVTADLTADTALSLTAQWGTANAANTLTGHLYNITARN